MQGVLPARLLLVDGAAAIRTELVGKAADLDFAQAVVDGAFDDGGRAAEPLFVRNA